MKLSLNPHLSCGRLYPEMRLPMIMIPFLLIHLGQNLQISVICGYPKHIQFRLCSQCPHQSSDPKVLNLPTKIHSPFRISQSLFQKLIIVVKHHQVNSIQPNCFLPHTFSFSISNHSSIMTQHIKEELVLACGQVFIVPNVLYVLNAS
jgi:hypothetical protein